MEYARKVDETFNKSGNVNGRTGNVCERCNRCKWEINWHVEEKEKKIAKRMSEKSKSTLEWYRGKEQLRYGSFYDGRHEGDLLFTAQTKSLKVNCRV